MKTNQIHPITRKRYLSVFLVFFTLSMFFIPNKIHAQSSQESRIETFTIPMPQLGDRPKNIQVYLPPDYDSSEKSYPVFYLHNGDDLFNPRPDAVGDYKVDETLDELFYNGSLDGVIVVGIEVDRSSPWDEYMPWVNENMHDWVNSNNSDPVQGGDGFNFIEFIVHTLKPEIDSRYRTLPDRDNNAIGGFCRGAIFPIVTGISYPDVFSKVMAMSPAVWMAEEGGAWLSNNNLINYINSNPLPDDVLFYLEIGTEESSGSRPPIKGQDGKRITYPQAYLEGAQAVYDNLLSNGVPESNIEYRIIEGSKGGRDKWGTLIGEVVMWFFSEEKTPPPARPTHSPIEKTQTQAVDPESGDVNEAPKVTSLFNDKFIIGVVLSWILLVIISGVLLWRRKKRQG